MAASNETLDSIAFQTVMPKTKPITKQSLPTELTYVGAIGFEDRALATLDFLKHARTDVRKAFLVRYDPPSRDNKDKAMTDLAESVCNDKPNFLTFNRFLESSWLSLEQRWAEIEGSGSNIVVDISGMSKFLILSALWAARKSANRIFLTYFQPKIYHPTEGEFRTRIASRPIQPGPFIIKGVSNVLTTPWMSSVSFDERPVLLVGFPNFDSDLLSEAVDELAPKSIFLIEPGEDAPGWWRGAFKELNNGIYQSPAFLSREIGTAKIHDYHDGLTLLENIYQAHNLRYRIVVAPTGSKLQALACFFFKVIHSDVELVYPSPMGYDPDSADGVGPGLVIELGNYAALVQTLRGIRGQKVDELVARLSALLRKEPQS